MHYILPILPFLLSILPSVCSAPIEAASTVSTAAYPEVTGCAPPRCFDPPPAGCPKPPSCDPWYRCPPLGWDSQPAGSVLAVREAPGNVFAMVSSAFTSKVFNVLFRTTDSRGSPTYAVTTVFKPATSAVNASNYRLMSYQHFYDSAEINSSPSCLLYEQNDDGNKLRLFLMRYLLEGWYLNVPDYEGVMAAYGAGRLSGQATLDSVRAVLRMGHLVGLNVSPDLAMYGYSGGSIATGWAAELARTYAPELKFKVAGIGGAIPRFEHTLRGIMDRNITDWQRHVPEVLIGLGTQWSELQAVAMQVFKLKTWEAVKNTARGASFEELKVYFKGMTNGTVLSCILRKDGDLGKAVPNMPLLIHRAENDALASTYDTDALYQYYKDGGANVFYHLKPSNQANSTGAHGDEGVAGASAVPNYLRDALNGKFPRTPELSNKVTKDWTTAEKTIPYGTPVW